MADVPSPPSYPPPAWGVPPGGGMPLPPAKVQLTVGPSGAIYITPMSPLADSGAVKALAAGVLAKMKGPTVSPGPYIPEMAATLPAQIPGVNIHPMYISALQQKLLMRGAGYRNGIILPASEFGPAVAAGKLHEEISFTI